MRSTTHCFSDDDDDDDDGVDVVASDTADRLNENEVDVTLAVVALVDGPSPILPVTGLVRSETTEFGGTKAFTAGTQQQDSCKAKTMIADVGANKERMGLMNGMVFVLGREGRRWYDNKSDPTGTGFCAWPLCLRSPFSFMARR